MMTRYFIGFIFTIGLIIVLIILIFHGGGKSKIPVTPKTLDSYAMTDAEVSLTIDGPINADQDHNQVRIIVSRDNSTFEKVQGYQGNVVNQQHYNSNIDAYTNFLLALAHAGFTKGSNISSLKDERGYCPLGQRFIFELKQGDQQLERYWATSCGSPKTYGGNTALTITLFQNQIPDYSKLTENLNLSV